MATSLAIRRAYENVLDYEIAVNDVSLRDIRWGVQRLAYVYAPTNSDFLSEDTKYADFNRPACRCAYLHKNAPIHTYVVQQAMFQIFRKVPNYFRNLLSIDGPFRICSLGGGPGSDAIGAITALLFAFGPFFPSVTIVDCMKKWEDSVALMMRELTVRPFHSVYNDVWSYDGNCQWNYLECNLLCSMTNEVNKSIAAASMITMVKFVSATTCKETENMVDKIFRVMKPGALVLFIDNAAGGFSQIIERSAKRNGLVPIFGPARHVEYEEEALKIERFGYTSCYKTKVTIILLQKLTNQQNVNSLQNATSQNPVNSAVANKRSHNANTNRPSVATSKSPAVGMPRISVPTSSLGQNRTGTHKKIDSNPAPLSAISNLNSSSYLYLQRPGATATTQIKSNVPNSAQPAGDFTSVNLCPTPSGYSGGVSPCDSPDFILRQPRPTAVGPPKFPPKSRSPNRSCRSAPQPSSAVRTYRPLADESSRRTRPQREVDDADEETGCSCCSIS